MDVGSAFANPELPEVRYANRMLDVALPPGVSPSQAMAEVSVHFDAAGARCLLWEMNAGAGADRTQPMIDHLLAGGNTREVTDVMYLRGFPAEPLHEVGDLKIIPARAAFKHARTLFEESARDWSAPHLADAKMLHLDDSHTDALLALRGGAAVAFIAVLAVGEIGAIQDLYVSSPYRRLGLGRTMMSRGLEICARSLFKHVFVGVAPENQAAIGLYERCGFKKIGQSVAYLAPG